MGKSITEILDEVKAEICDGYCRYPAQYGDNEDALIEERCNNCPLDRL